MKKKPIKVVMVNYPDISKLSETDQNFLFTSLLSIMLEHKKK